MSSVQIVSPFDRILYLKALPSLGRLSNTQASRLAHDAEEVHFGSGEDLISSDELNTSFYVIASGAARMERDGEHRFTARAGDTIGLVDMLAGGTGISARAETNVVALRFALPRILDMLEEDFELLQNTIRNLASVQQRLLAQIIPGTRRAPWSRGLEVPRDRDLDVIERLTLIQQGSLFKNAGLETGVMMAMSMEQQIWPADRALWEIGDPSGSVLMIVEGEVDGYLDDGQSFEAGLGYPLGNIEALAQKPRWYRPVPRTELVTLRADSETFFDVMEDDFDVAEVFIRAMSRGILDAMDALAANGESAGPVGPS
jgi:CRP-like cAMP-binding protein